MIGTVLRRIRPDHVQLRVVYDDNRLEGMLDGWEAETDTGKVEGGLRFEGAKVIEISPARGHGHDPTAAPAAALQAMLAGSERPVLTLPVGTLVPAGRRGGGRSRGRRARRLLAGNITLVTGTHTVVVKPTQLAARWARRPSVTRSTSRSTPPGCTRRSARHWRRSNRRRSTPRSSSPKRTP